MRGHRTGAQDSRGDGGHGYGSVVTETGWNIADVFERIADQIPDELAQQQGDRRFTWREFDERADGVARALLDAGLVEQDKVAQYLYNAPEYLESLYACFKAGMATVNTNYRYAADELVYLWDNADVVAVVFHGEFVPNIEEVHERAPRVRLWLWVDDGSGPCPDWAVPYEAVASTRPGRTEGPWGRSGDHLFLLYTGGTTGMPKGVVYPIGDHTFFFCNLAFPALGIDVPESADQIAGIAAGLHERGEATVSITGAPLMHGTGLWLGSMMHHLAGGHVVTLVSRSLDADEMLAASQRHGVTHNTIVGDAFSKPIITAIDAAAARGEPYDTSALKMMLSSGVMWTTEVKEQLLDRIPQAILFDAIGSSEGSMGNQITARGMPSETAKFTMNPSTKVFKDDDTEVTPGSDEVGMVAAGGLVPIEYYKDPEKSARTFRTIGGIRYSFPGDLAQVAADGTLILLGRGSQVINSGGEKIYPEEVEEAVKRADGIVDCLVVGVDDDKFGQAVTAVASVADGASPNEADVIATVKQQLASYKAPKRVIFVSEVPRAPNGKADYQTARRLASDATA